MITRLLIGIVFPGVILFQACNSSVSGPDKADNKGELPRALTENEQQLAERGRDFGYRIFRQTVAYDQEAENLMISPLSVSMALSMVLNGAQGDSYDEISTTLGFPGMNLQDINGAFDSLIELLITADPNVKMQIANSIWHQDNLPVKEDFLTRTKTHYDAEIEGLDFSDPAAVERINSWVNEHTEGLIPEIIEQIPDHMVMYVLNALYFKGEWLRSFDPEQTRSADFHLESGETTTVDMMHREGRFATFISEEVQMVELPYGDSLYSMTVMMPADPATPLPRFIKDHLNHEQLTEWRSELEVASGETVVELPRFELAYEIEFTDVLKAMGMQEPFDETSANLKGIADLTSQNLFIDNVKHKTYITVDEEGTEAAAATSVGVGVTSLPPQVTFDRPFVFIIYERKSGLNLFTGSIMDPGAE